MIWKAMDESAAQRIANRIHAPVWICKFASGDTYVSTERLSASAVEVQPMTYTDSELRKMLFELLEPEYGNRRVQMGKVLLLREEK